MTANRAQCAPCEALTKWHIHLNKAPSFPHDFSGNPDSDSNGLFLLDFWIPAYAGMTAFFLGFVPNFNIDRVCQQSEGAMCALFFIKPITINNFAKTHRNPRRIAYTG